MADKRIDKYFKWLCDRVSTFRAHDPVKTHGKLLYYLFGQPFFWVIDLDSNRAGDGLSLRYDYAIECDKGFDEYYMRYCSVLEMMVGVSLRCERDFTGDLERGYAVDKWFWKMIDNMGLMSYTDEAYLESDVIKIVEAMMYREYEPNGKGGLFIIKEPGADIRDLEIWKQMNWYISEQAC